MASMLKYSTASDKWSSRASNRAPEPGTAGADTVHFDRKRRVYWFTLRRAVQTGRMKGMKY